MFSESSEVDRSGRSRLLQFKYLTLKVKVKTIWLYYLAYYTRIVNL